MTTEALFSIKGKKIEFKTFPFQLKSVDEDQGTVTGYLSTFGNVDQQKDRVVQGAFRKTLEEAKSRKDNGRTFLFPMLWMHDPNTPIGGFITAQEDSNGLLVTAQLDITANAAGHPNNPEATKVFSGFKMGYIDEMSMGYIAMQKDFDKQGVRNLKECALVEGSAVTMLFAANPEALVPASGVKSMQVKGASGKTTWPLADRATKWDGGEATKDIEAWADGDWSKVAQCFFWVAKNPPEKISDCKLPFVANVGGEMKAIPQGIISCAGVLQGAMGGADLGGDEEAVKAKVVTYYKKMDMTPPWEDDGKMDTHPKERKDFNDLYQAAQAADCLEDWGDLINTLTQAMLQLFTIGDTPQTDMADCLEQFGKAVDAWVEKGIECNLSQYISDQGYCNTSTPYVPYALRTGSDYGYMSRRTPLQGSKAGRTISAATQSTLEQHQADMKAMHDELKNQSDDLAAQFKSMINTHVQAAQQKVSDLTQLWNEEGLGDPYTNDKSRLSRREPPARRTLTPARKTQPPTSTVSDEAIADLTALFS